MWNGDGFVYWFWLVLKFLLVLLLLVLFFVFGFDFVWLGNGSFVFVRLFFLSIVCGCKSRLSCVFFYKVSLDYDVMIMVCY